MGELDTQGARAQAHELDLAAVEELDRAVAALLGGAAIEERRIHDEVSTATLWELDVRLPNGERRPLILKDLGADAICRDARAIKPAFLRRPEREIAMYRLLAGHGLGTPEYVGSHIDAARDRYWLFLTRIDGAPLWQAGNWRYWEQAAAWLAALHDCDVDPEEGVPVAYGPDFYATWFDRARDNVGRGVFDALERPHERALERLSKASSTLVHGDFYPSNVLVASDGRICAVDFELAGWAPGALDLAALVTGLPAAVARDVVDAYVAARRVPIDSAELGELLLCARLHLAIRWLGWSAGWRPPARQSRDWLREATMLGVQIGSTA